MADLYPQDPGQDYHHGPCPRCAALESEVARLEQEVVLSGESAARLTRIQADFILRAERERDAKAALLRELAAATGMVDTAYRKLHVVEDAAGTYYSIPMSGFDRLGKAIVGLRSVLRRVDAGAGDVR